MGDSHLMVGVNPKLFLSCENWAQSAEPYFVTEFKIRKLISDSGSVKMVVLGFAPHNLSSFNDVKLYDPEYASEFFNRLYPLMGLDVFPRKEVPFNYGLYFQAYLRKMVLIPNLDHHKYRGGFSATQGTALDKGCDQRLQKHYGKSEPFVSTSQLSLDALFRIMDLLKGKNVKLVLVSTPLHPDYRSQIPELYLNKFEEVKTIIQELGVPIMDFSTLVLEDEMFKDCDHLNEEGATYFSKLLERSLSPDSVNTFL